MRPPISYYGGKQKQAKNIIPLIPKHTVYVEPFAGGAAILFNKPWPDVSNGARYSEVINDIDGNLINFYRMLRDRGEELIAKLKLTLHSEEEHKISKNLSCENELERARRYFVNISQSFVYQLHGGWRRSLFSGNESATWLNKIARLPEYLERMSSIAISSTDAITCIKQFDSPQTFFYCDPPYPGTDQGSYSGYTEQNFKDLCETLDDIQGSFILSNYDSDIPPRNWERFEFTATCSARGRVGYDRSKKMDESKQKRKRTEVVWRKLSTVPVRSEIQKLYDSGKFDCFIGGENAKRTIDFPHAAFAAIAMR